MKNIPKRNILSIVALATSLINIILLYRIDILPFKYFIFILITLIIVTTTGIILLNKNKKALKIVGIIILCILTLGNIITTYHMNNINDFLNKSFKETNTQKIHYYVIALKENNYTKKDISGPLGYYEKSINVKKALKKVTNSDKIEDLNFQEIKKLFDQLNSKELKFILLEKTNFNIITDIDDSIKAEDYQIIEEFDIVKKITSNNTSTKDSFNIYVGGTDYVGLMDFNTIITVNMKTHKLLLTSIPRDTYVDVYGYDYKNKLSFITEGIDVSKNSLAKFFNTDIAYYVKIDAESVAKLIDEIGGVEYCSDNAYTGTAVVYQNGYQRNVSYNIKKGCQNLNGYQAIAASRTRNAFKGRDRIRQQNMQNMMISIFKKISNPENITNYEQILNALADTYETNIPKKLLTKNIKDIINNGNKWQIETQAIDGEDVQGTVHRFSYITDWLIEPDMDTVKKASKRIKKVLK